MTRRLRTIEKRSVDACPVRVLPRVEGLCSASSVETHADLQPVVDAQNAPGAVVAEGENAQAVSRHPPRDAEELDGGSFCRSKPIATMVLERWLVDRGARFIGG